MENDRAKKMTLNKKIDKVQRRLLSKVIGTPMIDVTSSNRSDGVRKKSNRKHDKRSKFKFKKERKKKRAFTYAPTEPRMVKGSRQSKILSRRQLHKLWKEMPYRKRVCFWSMLYDSSRDGLSFMSLYNAVNSEQEAIMIIRTVAGDIFGFFSTEPWGLKKNSFYGTGESFLFSFDGSGNVKDKCIASRWTKKNESFMCCSDEFLAVGGGGKRGLGCAFCLDSNFHGSSHLCETFGNKPLVSSEDSNFVVQVIEVFGFRPCDRSQNSGI